MPSFSYFKRHNVDDSSTAVYTFDKLPNRPKIVCAPATMENPEYANEMARIVIEKTAKPEKPGKPSGESDAARAAESLATRLRSAEIITRVCARGFARAPVDDDGNELEFNTENVRLWLEGMATDCAWQFNLFCNWLVNPANFMPVSQPEAVQLAKN